MKNMMWALALFGLMFAAANGAGASSDVRQSVLEMRYAQMECRAAFLYSVMDGAEDAAGADLGQDRGSVSAVMERLREYAQEGDANAYNLYMSETRNAFTNAVRNTKGAQMAALNAAGSAGAPAQQGPGGVPSQTGQPGAAGLFRAQLAQQMGEQHQSAANEFSECMRDAVSGRIAAEARAFGEWHSNGSSIANSMEARGYSAGRMREILDEAEQASDELEAAASEGLSVEELNRIRSEKWGRGFYLWAQFQQERMGLLLDRFEGRTSGYGTEIAEIRAILASAASLGDDEVYTSDEAQESKRLVGVAAQQFSALVRGARGEE